MTDQQQRTQWACPMCGVSDETMSGMSADYCYDWDIRQHPSGFVHTLTSAVFDKLGHAQNAHQGASKRHPQNQYVICEIREIP